MILLLGSLRCAFEYVALVGVLYSPASIRPFISVAYPIAACKMGLYGYFASLATEVADSGVSVTICCPGPVAAAEGAAARTVYGAQGVLAPPPTATAAAASGKSDKGRMTPEVCACGALEGSKA
jgi:short-subunit dehydrogenase